MSVSHQFGGPWTEEKLGRLQKYLTAYMKIFKGNQAARRYTTTYVDAFAGTGSRSPRQADATTLPLFGDADATAFQRGSAQIALETEPSFDRFLFIDKNPEYALELENLRVQYPAKASSIEVVPGEANTVLCQWCEQTNWRTNRAVVFLDPYGMAVKWDTLQAIAQTKAIDLWILFPLGQAVNRLLTTKGPPEGGWASSLTQFFGTEEWKDAFYRPRQQLSFFDQEEAMEKEADFDSIAKFFVARLRTIFPGVANNPLPLRNSRNVPIYLLCFGASNEKGAPIAVRIASHILQK
jgi:three-Cys-motif partner protein